jgi:hypothetical protein
MGRLNLAARTAATFMTALIAMADEAGAQEATDETTGALPQETSTSPIKEGEAAVNQAPAASGMILVTKRPVEVLAGPSSSAAVLYGFPAGRPFRLIGRDAGFAQIQDLKSGATGWIDQAALAQPSSDPTVAEPNQKATTAARQDPQTTPLEQQGAVQKPSRQGPLSGFLGGLFGAR